MKICSVCKGSDLNLFLIFKQSTYWECNICGAKILDPKHHISYNDEKKHYLKHNNLLTDIKYRNFLSKLTQTIKDKISVDNIGLDYGCGYVPVLADILIKEGFNVELYDPFFFPNKDIFSRKFKFITCSEVVEHFFQPFEEFDKIDNLLDNNSWFGVMTSFLPEDNHFEKWYYIRDPTHVVFYNKKTFQHISFQRNWKVYFPSENIALFYKK